MDDIKNVAAQSTGDTKTPEVSSPQTEAPSTEEPQITPDVATPVAKPDELPDDPKEQRKAFQEMRQELKALKEERETRTKGESAFDAFRPQTQTPNQTPVRVEDFTDTFGTTNWDGYNNAVNTRLAHAEQLATQATTNVTDQLDEYEAKQKHPDLFSNPESEREIADMWFAAKMRGETIKIADLADRIAKRNGKVASKAEKLAAEKVLAEVGEKEQAGAGLSGQAGAQVNQAQAQVDYEQLRTQSRFGNEDALAARMRSIPWANK